MVADLQNISPNLHGLGKNIKSMLFGSMLIVLLGCIGASEVAAQGTPDVEAVSDSPYVYVIKPGENYEDLRTIAPPPNGIITRDGTSLLVHVMQPGESYKGISSMDPPPNIVVPVPGEGKPPYMYVLKPGETREGKLKLDPQAAVFIGLDQMADMDHYPEDRPILKTFYSITSNYGPIVLLYIVILAFILKNAYLLYVKKPLENLPKLGRSINAMLFWGAIVTVLCFIGVLIGMQTGMVKIPTAGAQEFAFFLLLISFLLKEVIFSLTCFLVISIVWYVFTCQHRKLIDRSMKEQYVMK